MTSLSSEIPYAWHCVVSGNPVRTEKNTAEKELLHVLLFLYDSKPSLLLGIKQN